MTLSEEYIKTHISKNLYSNKKSKYGYTSFYNQYDWTDFIIDENFIYSHRINKYIRKTFTECLHTHNYYELIIYIDGNINYITDNYIIKPKPYSAIWFCPGQMHTATLLSASEYERYVFYFTKEFFTLNNISLPMTEFTRQSKSNVFYPEITCIEEIKTLLTKIDSQFEFDDCCSGILTKALIIELFSIFNRTDIGNANPIESNSFCMKIKNYIDTEYASISTSEDIANKFHYSREHISRNFKNAFNISISDYIAKRRVLESLPLLGEMLISRAAYEVGFNSQSAFISAFVKNMGCLPSEYKKNARL